MNISGCECSKTLPNHLAFGVLLVESHLDIVYTEQENKVRMVLRQCLRLTKFKAEIHRQTLMADSFYPCVSQCKSRDRKDESPRI